MMFRYKSFCYFFPISFGMWRGAGVGLRSAHSNCSTVSFCRSADPHWGRVALLYFCPEGPERAVFCLWSTCCRMSAECSGYNRDDGTFVDGFSCPRPGNAISAVYCCGFNDVKYCCDDPNSFFPYEYGYMWWLRWGPGGRLMILLLIPRMFH